MLLSQQCCFVFSSRTHENIVNDVQMAIHTYVIKTSFFKSFLIQHWRQNVCVLFYVLYENISLTWRRELEIYQVLSSWKIKMTWGTCSCLFLKAGVFLGKSIIPVYFDAKIHFQKYLLLNLNSYYFEYLCRWTRMTLISEIFTF